MTRNNPAIILILLTACQSVTLDSQVVPVFEKYKELNARFLTASDSNGKAERDKAEDYMFHEYTEALKLLEREYCSEPNKNVLDAFISVLTATTNSAYETPSFVLGKIYICQPDAILEEIHSLKPEKKKTIVKTLDWGFQNATYQHKNEIKNYTELSSRLKSLKTEVE